MVSTTCPPAVRVAFGESAPLRFSAPVAGTLAVTLREATLEFPVRPGPQDVTLPGPGTLVAVELREKTADSTLLIVTQRISTVKNADQIIVLDDGEMVGKGTHQELMKSCETYREIALSQLSMEELS